MAIIDGSDGMAGTDDRLSRSREKSRAWRLANLEHSREQERIRARKYAAEKALAEGRGVPNPDIFRPKAALLTEDEKREKRRLKRKAWRDANPERSREIGRESMRRAAAAKAVAEGRVPGKIGALKLYTPEEKRAKRKAKSEKWNAAHLEEVREKAKLRERAKRAGTFVSKALPRLTEEEQRIVQVVCAANRRARMRKVGGRYTKDDIVRLMAEQEGKCARCGLAFGDDGYHVDHFVPLARGGSNDPSNLKLMHPVCNLTKGARDPADLGLVELLSKERD